MRSHKVFLILISLLALSTIVCSSFSTQGEEDPIQPDPTDKTPTEPAPQPPAPSASEDRRERLAAVTRWFYFLDFEPDEIIFDKLVESSYDMIVLEPILTDRDNIDFPMEEIIDRLHSASHPKLIIAYIDIGQAEDWRTYWQPGWEIGDPDWIVAADPDGWEGNFPVAYWREEWREIWLDDDGYLQMLLDLGYDGIYLDWVEAYSDENIIWSAEQDGIDPVDEMKRWVADLAMYSRQQQPDFLVIAQNAAELVEHDDYLAVIDAISQEQTWFDGSAENDPPGDCPLPRTEEDIDSDEYIDSLNPKCRRMYEDYPDSTLHVSSEWYLDYLIQARQKGLTVFTVDYALDPNNAAWVYQTSRDLDFIPFVGERLLATYFEPVP